MGNPDLDCPVGNDKLGEILSRFRPKKSETIIMKTFFQIKSLDEYLPKLFIGQKWRTPCMMCLKHGVILLVMPGVDEVLIFDWQQEFKGKML